MRNIKNKPWYSLTVSICIGVILFVVLLRFSSVLSAVGTFLGFFSTIFLGAIIAYIINPLAMFYRRKIFGKLKNEKLKATFGNTLAFMTVIAFLMMVLLLVVPQLVDSISMFAKNFNGYVKSLEKTLEIIGMSSVVDLDDLISSSTEILDYMATYVTDNMGTILSTTANIGSSMGHFFIALLLSMYFLAGKDNLKKGGARFLKAVFKENYPEVRHFIKRSDEILNCYIVFNLIDAIIVGIVNAIFMTVMGMPYVGLVSIIVALTNIIPTFGPFVGGAIGAFFLLLVEPWYAAAFLIFVLVLQTIDGYILKPKLFGDSLGVSGLWILIGVVALGSMFGMIGVLLAIPGVAILDMVYHEYVLAFLEREDVEEVEEDIKKED
ncbi:AI-2E family transporter [Pseudobutyrivibrio sp. MD2005]|uniref:AI-2E family transporter n=1 Tax=Pseudobutyrivibrio sp. MD2005 TaxID=1410616 RepID=UPI0006874BB8|nr:AI-2E family transporter [Pseudobutyrivibrio sp. MD2005]